MDNKSWQFDFEEYIRQGEAGVREKSYAWQTAIGLQDVDRLEPSSYLLETAKAHIEGEINIGAAKARIETYYETRGERKEVERDTEEADKVSVRIAELLSEQTFQFSPMELIEIHRRLFAGIYEHAGRVRPYNITKKEWVLEGETVLYAAADSIRPTLDYDFSMEKNFSYEFLSIHEAVRHIAKFTSDIWQIHPFCEGNTRTTAVFIIKYLRTFGFEINNDIFAANSWYFRNALVRANYNNFPKGIHATIEYLELFFENLLLGTEHVLKNRFLVVSMDKSQSANIDASKCKIEDSKCKNCTLEEVAVLKLIEDFPEITQKEMAKHIGKSERTVKNLTISLQEKQLIQRVNGKRNGKWIVLSERQK